MNLNNTAAPDHENLHWKIASESIIWIRICDILAMLWDNLSHNIANALQIRICISEAIFLCCFAFYFA